MPPLSQVPLLVPRERATPSHTESLLTVCNSKLLMVGCKEPQKEKPKCSPERLKQNTELTPAALKHWKPRGST